MTRILALSLAIAALSYVAADSETTIIVPFGDPQPISADILGVDTAQGRTTWQLRQGAFTGTWTDPQGSFPGTATLVEGADYASFTYSAATPEGTFAVGGECTIKDGVEICVASQEGGDDPDSNGTVTETDTATPFGVQIAATGVPAGAGAGSSSGAAAGSKPTGASSGSGSPSSSAPGNTPSGSASRTSASGVAAMAGLLLAYHFV
ncbi:hypothetical protein B0H19DRAFT_1082123 [Mycena capillaripes]|nr:hypothetical protein B0H19DRAFT_1082123 [Mycena capillaripes]